MFLTFGSMFLTFGDMLLTFRHIFFIFGLVICFSIHYDQFFHPNKKTMMKKMVMMMISKPSPNVKRVMPQMLDDRKDGRSQLIGLSPLRLENKV